MAEKKLIIEKRGERSYVYCVQNVYDPQKKHTYKKKEYCGVFAGTYDAEGKPEYRKARQGSAPAEIFRFRDAINTFVENSVNSGDGISWSETKFKTIKNKELIYFSSAFEILSCNLEIFVPFGTDDVYCRFFQIGPKKAKLRSEYNIEALFGKDINAAKRFSTGDTENQVLLCNNKLQQDKLPEVYTGSTIFAYSKNQDQLKEIKLLADSYEVIESVILPYLPYLHKQRKFKDEKDLLYLSKLSTKLLRLLLRIEIKEGNNRSIVINDLISRDTKFIKVEGKWIRLEERVTMPCDWLDEPKHEKQSRLDEETEGDVPPDEDSEEYY